MPDLRYSIPIKDALNEWAKECGEGIQMLYKIEGDEVFIYTTTPGVVIGGGGKLIAKYQEILKKAEVSKVNLVELKDARIPRFPSYLEELDEY